MKYKIVKKDFGVKTPDIREVAVVEDIDALEALPRGSAIVFRGKAYLADNIATFGQNKGLLNPLKTLATMAYFDLFFMILDKYAIISESFSLRR